MKVLWEWVLLAHHHVTFRLRELTGYYAWFQDHSGPPWMHEIRKGLEAERERFKNS